MIKFFIALGLTILLFMAIVVLSNDVELNPKAKTLLEQIQKQPNLDNNAYISLMALNYSGPNTYQQAKNDYLQATSLIENHNFDFNMRISFPQIPVFNQLKDDPQYRDFPLLNKHEELRENRDIYTHQLALLNQVITQLHSINDTNNFDALNPFAIDVDLSLLELFVASGTQIFYLIEDKKLDVAARKLVNLIALEKRLTKNGNVSILSFLSIRMIFRPLIEYLHRQNFTSWGDIKATLTPLNMEYISMNQSFKNLFLTNSQIVTMTFHSSQPQGSSFYQQQRVETLLKPNKTINELWLQTERLLIPNNISKAQLLKYETTLNKAREQRAEDLKNSNSLTNWVKNYDNILGYFLRASITPLFIDDYRELVSSDLTILLLKALIQTQSQSVEQVINSEEFLNPYTLEKPTFDGKQLCYQLDANPICVNRDNNP